MTDRNPDILELLDREWRDLCSGIRQNKLEELFMQVTAAVASPVAEITDAERAEALAAHDQVEKELLAAIEGLRPSQWTFKPGPDRWSIQEVAEHVTAVEARLSAAIADAVNKDPDPNVQEQPGAFDAFRVRVLDRSMRNFNAPAPLQPAGQWNVAETVQRYKEAHGKIRELLEKPGLPLKDRAFSGLPGTFTLHHWLLLIPMHTRRHLGQIVEIKTTHAGPGYPG